MTEKKTVIDIGTNSIKYCTAERSGTDNPVFVTDTSLPMRLGEGLHCTGRISAEALERNACAVAELVKRAQEDGSDEIAVIGTAAVRGASNSCEFCARVLELSGVPLRVLSGEEEAQLSYEAIVSGLSISEAENVMTMDTGGGSTEFVFARGGEILRRFSVPLGAVVVTERYGLQNAVEAQKLERVRHDIKYALSCAGVHGGVSYAAGVGGI